MNKTGSLPTGNKITITGSCHAAIMMQKITQAVINKKYSKKCGNCLLEYRQNYLIKYVIF
jgi:hypothetical protein